MIIDNIVLERSPVHAVGIYVLHIEAGGNKFSGYFEANIPSFVTCVTDAAKYFAVRHGLLKNKDARATREIVDVPVRRQ